MSPSRRMWSAWAFYLVLGLIVFHGALNLGFWADDPRTIWISQRDWFDDQPYYDHRYQFLICIYAITAGFITSST